MLQRRLVDQTGAPVAGQEPHVLRQHPPFPAALAVRPDGRP